MAPTTPYTPDLNGREPIEAIRDTASRIEALTASWTADDYQRSYAAGKWTARQILIHLTQTELALGTRARMALSTPHYAAQSFDQDSWMTREAGLSGGDARHAYVTLSRLNANLFGGLSAADRQTPFSHPEYGALTVDWIIHQTAGHQIHHLHHLQTIARG